MHTYGGEISKGLNGTEARAGGQGAEGQIRRAVITRVKMRRRRRRTGAATHLEKYESEPCVHRYILRPARESPGIFIASATRPRTYPPPRVPRVSNACANRGSSGKVCACTPRRRASRRPTRPPRPIGADAFPRNPTREPWRNAPAADRDARGCAHESKQTRRVGSSAVPSPAPRAAAEASRLACDLFDASRPPLPPPPVPSPPSPRPSRDRRCELPRRTLGADVVLGDAMEELCRDAEVLPPEISARRARERARSRAPPGHPQP